MAMSELKSTKCEKCEIKSLDSGVNSGGLARQKPKPSSSATVKMLFMLSKNEEDKFKSFVEGQAFLSDVISCR